MNELIKVDNEIALLDPATAEKIVKFETAMKQLKKQEDELKKIILKEMEAKNIVGIETDELAITYVAPYDKETLDSQKLKADHQDLYDEYAKFTTVRSSIRVKVK